MALACAQGNINITELLLAGGITARQLNNEEVLKIAAQIGHTEIVELLLTAPGISPNSGYPLEVAASKGHTEIVKLLLAAPDIRVNDGECLIIEKTNRWGSTSRSYIPDNCGPLIKAVKYNHIEIVRLLLATPGIDVNHTCQDGNFEYTPLMQAVADSRTEIVKLLLAAPGIDVDKQYRWGRESRGGDISPYYYVPPYEVDIYETALSLAEKRGNTEIIKLLRAAGARK
jgi:ankyrin repeat protein